MALGHHVPEWASLSRALDEVASDAGARNAVVTDAWGHLWCRAAPLSGEALDRVLALAARIAGEARPPLSRGGKIDRTRADGTELWVARSFAGVYVLIVLYDGAFAPARARAAIDAHLAAIEALTLALPSPDGPDATSGARRMGEPPS
jgi:hypothetical protein